jgi:hypothetical protein
MKKKMILGTILTLSLAFIVSSVCITPAFAITTYTEQSNAWGSSVIDVPGQTTVFLLVQHFNKGDYYKGSADRINLYIGMKPVAAYEDNPTRFAFSQEVGKGGPVSLNLVRKGQIQIFRLCKTVFVYWTVPLVMPATEASLLGPATPAVTIPPGCLIIRGYGDAQPGITKENFPLSGWSLSGETTGYTAKATLICPGWHYCGPVAETDIHAPKSITKATLVWTGP